MHLTLAFKRKQFSLVLLSESFLDGIENAPDSILSGSLFDTYTSITPPPTTPRHTYTNPAMMIRPSQVTVAIMNRWSNVGQIRSLGNFECSYRN